MDASIIILSGGLDSAVSASIAKEQTRLERALFFDYGQRAAQFELRAATAIAKHLAVPLQTIELPWLGKCSHSSLTDSSKILPRLKSNELDDRERTEQTAKSVWVPNRNGVFLNVAAALAESVQAQVLVTGFNAEEAVTFPDNSAAFVKVASEFFKYSTQNAVRVISYTQEWDKTEIVRQGLKYQVPFEVLWSCYEDGLQHCGQCESCQRSMRAYQAAEIWERMKARFYTS